MYYKSIGGVLLWIVMPSLILRTLGGFALALALEYTG